MAGIGSALGAGGGATICVHVPAPCEALVRKEMSKEDPLVGDQESL